MEEILKQQMGYKRVESTGKTGGGCINKGEAYETENGLIFVKHNSRPGSLQMFIGEFAGLAAIQKTATLLCPRPLKTIDLSDSGACLVTDFVDLTGRGGNEVVQEFGRRLARMHKHNQDIIQKIENDSGKIGSETLEEGEIRFGFEEITCCGALPLNNHWKNSWPEFYIQNRLVPQIDRILEEYGDGDLKSKYSELIQAIERLFSGYKEVSPALLHGDLWSGNWGTNRDGQPVIFDPASFYGDPEFEQGIMNMFGGFGRDFWSSYHQILPKKEGREKRIRLYELFHHLNHWNHFGSSYESGTMKIIDELIKGP